MTLARIDHIIVCAEDLDSGSAHVESALGVTPAGGGAHLGWGTHNRLLSLGDIYLEVIAPNPDDAAPGRPRMFDMDRFSGAPRLKNWVFRTDRLSDAIAYAPEDIGEPEALGRDRFQWEITVPDRGHLPFGGAFPALIQWEGDHPAPLLPDSGCRVVSLTITHPEADAFSTALAPFLGDPRVTIQTGEKITFSAEIDTPSGRRTLA